MQRNPSSRRPPVQRMTPQQRKVVRPGKGKFQPKQGKRTLPR